MVPDSKFARIRCAKSGEERHQGGFARPVWPEQSKKFTGKNIERYSVQGGYIAVAFHYGTKRNGQTGMGRRRQVHAPKWRDSGICDKNSERRTTFLNGTTRPDLWRPDFDAPPAPSPP